MKKLEWETIEEILEKLAKRVSRVRKRKKISQEQLSVMSGVSFGSIKRFERTGQISFYSLTRIAIALDCVYEIKKLFTEVEYLNIEEVFNDKR